MTIEELYRCNLNLLIGFCAIYEERNVTNAAIRMKLSQPAMSRILSRLRELFRDPLFYRSRKGLIPSEKANMYYLRIKNSLLLIKSALSIGESLESKIP